MTLQGAVLLDRSCRIPDQKKGTAAERYVGKGVQSRSEVNSQGQR